MAHPSTRPQDWQPTHNDMDADDDGDELGAPTDTQTLAHHMFMAESGTNPQLEALFGKAIVERIRLKSDLLAKRKPGRPKKNEKSSSGALGPSGVLSQQLNGSSLPKIAKGPSKAALKGVQQRTGGLVDFGTLVHSNTIPGHILVCLSLIENCATYLLLVKRTRSSIERRSIKCVDTRAGQGPFRKRPGHYDVRHSH